MNPVLSQAIDDATLAALLGDNERALAIFDEIEVVFHDLPYGVKLEILGGRMDALTGSMSIVPPPPSDSSP
jgi:hypothetical protein